MVQHLGIVYQERPGDMGLDYPHLWVWTCRCGDNKLLPGVSNRASSSKYWHREDLALDDFVKWHRLNDPGVSLYLAGNVITEVPVAPRIQIHFNDRALDPAATQMLLRNASRIAREL